MFGLLDCNNFFVSCQRVFEPRLEGRPVVVLSNNDGCIIARSNEAKAVGIPMGAPVHEWAQLIKKHHVQMYSCNFELYADISSRVMRVVREMVPCIEVYSVDEAFLDLSGIPPALLVDMMRQLREAVLRGVGIPVCIGIAPTKVLAKVANHVAKKNLHLNGVHMLETEEKQVAALEAMPLKDVWGLGRKLSVRLKCEGVVDALALRNSEPLNMRRRYSVMMEKMVWELRGVSCSGIEEVANDKMMIMASRSFGRRVFTLEDLQEAVAAHVNRAACQMRGEGLLAQALVVYIRTGVHNPRETYYGASHTVGMEAPTADIRVLTRAAHTALKEIFVEGHAYYKAGIYLLELVPVREYQPSLLHAGDDAASVRLMAAMDLLGRRFKDKYLVRLASTGTKQDWQVKHERRSPRYSTRWKELKVVT